MKNKISFKMLLQWIKIKNKVYF